VITPACCIGMRGAQTDLGEVPPSSRYHSDGMHRAYRRLIRRTTTPLATAGDESTGPPVGPTQSGEHVPLQPAGKAYRLSSSEPT